MRRSWIPAAAGIAVLLGAGCAGGGSDADVASPAAEASSAPTDAPVTTDAPTTTEPASPTTVPPPTVPSTTVAPPTVAPTTSATLAPEPVVRSGANRSQVTEVGDPISISIPEIGVEGSLIPTGVLPDGTVDVPADPSIAGWFTGGPRPGEQGPAVIMGHVDSRQYGPGVFFRLAELPIGATVIVNTTTGPQEFVVRSIEQFPKAQFPTDLVYGAEPGSTLRLITCGGSFDESIRHYRDNIVAFLVRTGP